MSRVISQRQCFKEHCMELFFFLRQVGLHDARCSEDEAVVPMLTCAVFPCRKFGYNVKNENAEE